MSFEVLNANFGGSACLCSQFRWGS